MYVVPLDLSFYIRSSHADTVIEPMFYWLNLYIGLHKLKVYDMDGDGRSEVLVVFPLVVSSEHGAMGSSHSALAFVLDEVDWRQPVERWAEEYEVYL